ncbi:SAV_915 family protein [uncultured Streptomyces sp.]|uniref:SAV_915 family protein n=1 Tax=uncultured Streptomyces sp. TaxID=174707 RepID=UPI0026033D9B|nr:SAV_915 family protein [uncultured Streptomyces sp.]
MDPASSEPDPLEPVPAGPLFVPVRPGSERHASVITARLFRTPLGDRTAVAFTSPARLARVLGAAQGWIVLSEPALRALAAPLGVRRLVVDPQFSAAPVAPSGRVAAADRPSPVSATGLALHRS